MWRHGRDIWGGQAEKCVISYPFACFWCQMGGYKQRRGEREKGRVIRGTVLWNLRYKFWRAGSCLSKGAVKGHWDSACCLLAVPCARRCWPPRFPSPLPHPYTVISILLSVEPSGAHIGIKGKLTSWLLDLQPKYCLSPPKDPNQLQK